MSITAQIMAPVGGMVCIVFSGFLITRSKIDPWFIWIYYISPFAWTTRAYANVEYHSSRYTEVRLAVPKPIVGVIACSSL